MEYRFCLVEKEKSLFFQLVLHVSYSSTRVCSWVIFLLPFLSTSVFILIKQMKTLIEAGNGGGLRWRGMLQEMYVTHWGCKSAWLLLRLYNSPLCLLWLGRIRWWWVVTHLGRGAELEETDGNFSLYYSRRVKIYRLCVLAVGQEPPKKVLKMWPLFSRMSI